jgi:hypothetical protein
MREVLPKDVRKLTEEYLNGIFWGTFSEPFDCHFSIGIGEGKVGFFRSVRLRQYR